MFQTNKAHPRSDHNSSESNNSPKNCSVESRSSESSSIEENCLNESRSIKTRFIETYSIAGKIFILGEYAVLAGSPAMLAAVGPRFRMQVDFHSHGHGHGNGHENGRGHGRGQGHEHEDGGKEYSPDFHPDSPMGRLQEWAIQQGFPKVGFQFEDPLSGAGGLGASTAQFAMAYLAYVQRADTLKKPLNRPLTARWDSAWNLYRELMTPRSSSEGMTPSGADLVAQWQGGVSFVDFENRRCEELWPFLDSSGFLVFSATGQAGRKVPTHEHLQILTKQGFPHSSGALISELRHLVTQGRTAVLEQNRVELGKILNRYADCLQKAGLEVDATTKDRHALQTLPGVLGVKGMGALQSDGLIVLLSPDAPRNQVIEVAQSLGLKLVCDGLTCEMGVIKERHQAPLQVNFQETLRETSRKRVKT